MTPEAFLKEALELIEGERTKEYGDSEKNHARIAKMWGIILKKEITVKEVYLCMIAIKLSRLTESPNHEDSWLDIVGYAALAQKEDK